MALRGAGFLIVVLLAAACGTRPPPITYDAVVYEAVLPAASGGGEHHVRVTLKTGGEAALSSTFSSMPSRFLAEGTWRDDDGRITVNLGGQTLVFDRRGDHLVTREWDRALWGEAGPGRLFRVR